MRLTHSELCALCVSHAVKRGAVFVCSEKGDRERPDVFALFRDGSSVVYECKASRSDFKADRNKPFRKNPSEGMGCERIYVVNEGVCKPSEIPDGWRLAVAQDIDRLKMVIPCVPVFSRDKERIHRFVSDDSAALALIAAHIAAGLPPLPENVYDVKVTATEPGAYTLKRLKTEGRCFVCRNRCHKGREESYGCEAFFPDYGKLLE